MKTASQAKNTKARKIDMGDVHEQGALFFSPTGTGALADMTITSPGVIRQHSVKVFLAPPL